MELKEQQPEFLSIL